MNKPPCSTPYSVIMAVTCYIAIFNLIAAPQFSSVKIIFVMALTFGWLLALFSLWPRLLKGIIAFMLLVASVALYARIRYHSVITEGVILSLWVSDASLSREVLSWSAVGTIMFFSLLPIFYILRRSLCRPSWRRYIAAVAILSTFVLISAWALGIQSDTKGSIRNPIRVHLATLFSPLDVIIAAYKSRKEYKYLQAKHLWPKTPHGHFRLDNHADLVIMIIGESTRGDHLAINGYARPTTPILSTIKGMYSWHQARACDTITLRALPYMFADGSCNHPSRTPWTQAPWTRIMAKLGYQIEIISLQSLSALYQMIGYDKLLDKYTLLSSLTQPYARDEALTHHVRNRISRHQQGEKLVLIIHTLGSHHRYSDRYTRVSAKFIPECRTGDITGCSLVSLRNSYDNTILEVDRLVANIISAASSHKALVVYVSDHGESLGENGYYLHGIPKEKAPSEQFDIGWLMWFSPSLSQAPQARQLAKQFDPKRAIDHGWLFHTMLGCAGVVSDDNRIDATRNLCHRPIVP